MKIKLWVLGVTSLGVVIGMFYQIVFLFQIKESVSATFLFIGLLSFVGFVLNILKRLLSELKLGIPSEDERSKKVKFYSAGKAYFYSLYIWISLLAFQRYFNKDDILLIGLIGMLLTLLLSWIFTKNKKGLEQ